MIEHVAEMILERAAGATHSPEDALSVLNVLPIARNARQTILAAVLSRGFSEYQPARVLEHGHLYLLSHYPGHIILATLKETFVVAGEIGDLPALVELWNRTGPGTSGHATWTRLDYSGLLTAAMKHGHTNVVDWYLTIANPTLAEDIPWRLYRWGAPAAAGYTNVLHWSLDRGYLEELTPDLALLSASKGNTQLFDRWFSSQGSATAAMSDLVGSSEYLTFLCSASVQALDWWWMRVANGSELPLPEILDKIVKASLGHEDTAVVEWWWARFLRHRTPEHTFGSRNLTRTGGWSFAVEGADWLWQHSHSSGTHWDSSLHAFPFAPDWHDADLPSLFDWSPTATAPLMQWWIEKSIVLGKTISFTPDAVSDCVRQGKIDVLDCILHMSAELEIDWGPHIVVVALQNAMLSPLMWWETHQDQLPPQDLDCSLYLEHVAAKDAADVLEWWYTRFPTVPTSVWQRICTLAIRHNARAVQGWLRAHPDVVTGAVTGSDPCMTLYTLDFVVEFASHLGLAKPEAAPLTSKTLAHIASRLHR
ncbi:hypothetical protein BC828DRAFT_166203 [Blastocladiella britannica]|nr:hypothetical protein BC828DRAFT_166203 [Blastocladiella britannica]